MRIMLFLLVFLGLAVSFAMAVWPERVLVFATKNGPWRLYLQKVLRLSPEFLSTARAAGWVRAQGIVGALFALLGLFAWARG